MKNKAENITKLKFHILLVKQISILSLIMVLAFSASGQLYLSEVDFDMIEEEAVVDYLYRQINNDINVFTKVEPSLKPNSKTEGFNFHEMEYVLEDSLKNVWQHYIHTNPAKAWNTSSINFGFMFSKRDTTMVYPYQNVEKVETGQIIYLNLNLLKIKNIATAFEITAVDKDKGIIEFSYIKDNITLGKQQVYFEQTNEGHTKILHRSYFKSKSKTRDRYLYPYFHTRLTNAYHRNMKRIYKEKKGNKL